MRKLAGLTTMILLALLLAACGDDDGEATEEATTVAGIASEASTEAAIETETVEATAESAATPANASENVAVATVFAEGASSPVATAVPGGMATPAAAELPPSVAGTPMASPVAATPAASAVLAPAGGSGDDPDATPSAAANVTLAGTVVLPGTANEAWVITADGCVGLGAYGDLKTGRQLVIRDAEGAIVGVTTLEDSGETDSCAWSFALEVPASPFYAVSIPMVVEHVFTQQEVEQSDGEIVVPAA